MSKNIFVNFGPIKGSSKDASAVGDVVVNSFSFNASKQLVMEAGNTKRTSGVAILSNITITKDMDVATATLYEYCLLGNPIKKVTLTYGDVVKEKFVPTVTYEIGDVFIKSISTSGSGTVPSESISLDFNTISCKYGQQGVEGADSGKSVFTYNRSTGTTKIT
jgi:type VI secretion system secreted protein Hcp